MNFEEQIRRGIELECEKLITRYHDYHNRTHADWVRQCARVSNPPKKIIRTPEYWSMDQKFNPFYVKSKSGAIARSIAKKIASKTYEPNDPYLKQIPKSGGGTRQLTIFQIPDAAVSKYFYNRLLAKNKHRFSSFSYAYRNDRNVHFAIQDIAVDLRQNARTFIAEFDFSDFFGSIDHKYLVAQLGENGFLVSEEDEYIIKSFLKKRECGIPQGTSISLFLANLVCWKLDKSLEKTGLKFARYADDTVIWSLDYQSICRSFQIIDAFSKESGVAINPKKSDGISLLTQDGLPAEIHSKPNFGFLGYSIGASRVSIREKVEKRIKKQISYLLYRNLIQPIRHKPLKGLVIPSNNKDDALLSALMQVRRYLYGGLLNRDLIDYTKGRKKFLDFKGVMSFYPLIDDEEQLKALDGWLLSVINRSVKRRHQLLLTHGHNNGHSFPFCVKREDIILTYRKRRVKGKKLLEVPSFMLVYKALKKGLRESGIERIMHPKSNDYDY
jgi:RNA-directed DNA polymerase